MEVLIDNQQDLLAIPNANLKQTARDILSVLGCHDGELSLLIVDDDKIRPLNEQYRGRAGATNVLAFPMNEGAFAEVMPHLLGDVVISVETCLREAKTTGITFEHHFTELLIHGILHLLGYDHEQSEEEEHRMTMKSEEVLHQLETLLVM